METNAEHVEELAKLLPAATAAGLLTMEIENRLILVQDLEQQAAEEKNVIAALMKARDSLSGTPREQFGMFW